MARILGTEHVVIPVDLELTFGDLENSVTQLKSIVFNTLDQYPLQRISFVGHSTGGIAIRMLLKDRQIADKTYACVFVAVPNQGTVLADAHQTVVPKLFRSIHKPIAQLTRCFIQSLDLECPLHVAFGGIAGLKNWQSTSGLFSGPNDGVVAVSSVYLEDMTDFIQMPCDHITIMKDFATTKAILHFMNTLSFPSNLQRLGT
jgi:hypothetical protein|tara:strand:- start:2794 stop:3399 length:606 start_codon:yes stop_codon:yes gene_type:complete